MGNRATPFWNADYLGQEGATVGFMELLPRDNSPAGSGPFRIDTAGNVTANTVSSAGTTVLTPGPAGTNDVTNIQATLNLAKPGSTVTLAGGSFNLDGASGLSVPSGVELLMANGDRRDPLTGAVLTLAATFTAAAVVGFPTGSSEQKLTRVLINGAAAPANSVIGIDYSGIQQITIREAVVYGAGISTGVKAFKVGSTNPLGASVDRLTVSNVGGRGVDLSSATDNNWTRIQVIASGSDNIRVAGCQNSRFTQIQADFAALVGLSVTGSGWGTGAGSGGAIFTAVSTDRNGNSGVSVTSTGNGPITFNGLMCRRDGSASTSSNYAGLKINGATTPVIVNGITVYPGVEDDGTGSATPQFGVDIRGVNTYVSIGGAGFVQGISAAINDTGQSAYAYIAPAVGTAIGTSASPVVDGPPGTSVTSEVDVANTGTETTLITVPLPSGYLKAGTAFRVFLRGTVQCKATSGTLTFQPYLGANASPQAPQMASQGSAAGPNPFNLDIMITVRTAGASGTYIAGGYGRIDFATAAVFTNTGALTTAVVDTTAANPVLKVTATWATADVANALKITEGVIHPVFQPTV